MLLLKSSRLEPVVGYLRALIAAGARLHGAADPSFATIRVLAGARRAAKAAERSAAPTA